MEGAGEHAALPPGHVHFHLHIHGFEIQAGGTAVAPLEPEATAAVVSAAAALLAAWQTAAASGSAGAGPASAASFVAEAASPSAAGAPFAAEAASPSSAPGASAVALRRAAPDDLSLDSERLRWKKRRREAQWDDFIARAAAEDSAGRRPVDNMS